MPGTGAGPARTGMTETAAGMRCYAVRRVNPFEGVLEVIALPRARAYSPNGTVWQVQVLAARPDHTWRSGSNAPLVEQFFGFGLWDADAGLHRIPANPVMDIGAMQAAADALVTVLEQAVAGIPFPLTDNLECWSVDDRGFPIALLATSDDPDRIDDIRVTHWMATHSADHGFFAPSLAERGAAPAGSGDGTRRHAEQLEQRVRAAEATRAWYRRLTDGSGQRLRPDGHDDVLPLSVFPTLGLRSAWPDEPTNALVRDYLEWSAPRLLTLQHLPLGDRERLEQVACRQAVELANWRRLYPAVVDARRVEAACVEARRWR